MKFLINITHAFPTLRELMVPNGSSKVLQGARTSWRTSLFTVQGSSPHLFSLHWHLNFLMIFKSSDENNCGLIFCPFSFIGWLIDRIIWFKRRTRTIYPEHLLKSHITQTCAHKRQLHPEPESRAESRMFVPVILLSFPPLVLCFIHCPHSSLSSFHSHKTLV